MIHTFGSETVLFSLVFFCIVQNQQPFGQESLQTNYLFNKLPAYGYTLEIHRAAVLFLEMPFIFIVQMLKAGSKHSRDAAQLHLQEIILYYIKTSLCGSVQFQRKMLIFIQQSSFNTKWLLTVLTVYQFNFRKVFACFQNSITIVGKRTHMKC